MINMEIDRDDKINTKNAGVINLLKIFKVLR